MQYFSRSVCLLVFFVIALSACNNASNNSPGQQNTAYKNAIQQQIAAGKRLENINNGSLKIVAQKLDDLYKLSGDKVALTYADLNYGLYFWQAAKSRDAMHYAVTTLADADKFGIKQPLPQIYALIANLNKESTNYKMAIENSEKGLKAAQNNKDTASIIALLGMNAMVKRGYSLSIHQPQRDDQSLELNLEALKIAESSPKYERIRIRFYDNLSQYYVDKGDLQKAFAYGNKGVALALKFDQKRSLTYGYCWLGMAYYNSGDHKKGIEFVNKAIQVAVDIHEPYRVMELNASLYNCYNSSADYKDAMHYYEIFRNMRDSLKVLDNSKQISDLQLKYESTKKDKEISVLGSQSRLAKLRFEEISIVLVLLVVIGILTYVREKNAKKLLLLQKIQVDSELQRATIELQYFTENLRQQNEIIEEFKTEIEYLQTKTADSSHADNLDKLMNFHIMTDESWDSFKNLFSKVHNKFFGTIKTKYPNITTTDVRMLSLIKLQLDNREIASMLGITVEGVRKSKHRLRKKMELAEDVTIESVIVAI